MASARTPPECSRLVASGMPALRLHRRTVRSALPAPRARERVCCLPVRRCAAAPRPARKLNTFQSAQAHSAEPGQSNKVVVCQGAQRGPAPAVPTTAPEAPCCVTEVCARPPQSPGRSETGQGPKGDGRARVRARRGGGRACGEQVAAGQQAQAAHAGAVPEQVLLARAPAVRGLRAHLAPVARLPGAAGRQRARRRRPALLIKRAPRLRAHARGSAPSAAGQQARTRRVSAAR